MKSYLLRRGWQSLLVLFGVSVVVFLILHLTGDPALLLLPPDASAEDVVKFRTAMGFDDPRSLTGVISGVVKNARKAGISQDALFVRTEEKGIVYYAPGPVFTTAGANQAGGSA